jgi:hypothetical protein
VPRAQTLRDAARDAHAGERARAGAEGDRVEPGQRVAAFGQHLAHAGSTRSACAGPARSSRTANVAPSPQATDSVSVELSRARMRIPPF